jgi:phosphoadenosine phosphosulfate reductase
MNGEYSIDFNKRFRDEPVTGVLEKLLSTHDGKIIFTTSFGLEDQVITDMICRHDLNVKIVTLDTGRLFEETYKTYRSTLEKYGKPIIPYFPPQAEVEELLAKKGPFSFYESIENRKECCHIRRVIPLTRALEGMEIWVTGIRAQQSATRSGLSLFEWDEGYQLVKYNPLLHWDIEAVRNYIKENNVPYNILHDRGFPSIGCAPCTRAIQPGEDFRAGRWWWEQNSGKECGIHTHNES